jgi:hypothetical protein
LFFIALFALACQLDPRFVPPNNQQGRRWRNNRDLILLLIGGRRVG